MNIHRVLLASTLLLQPLRGQPSAKIPDAGALRAFLGMTPAEWARVERGAAAVKLIPHGGGREVAVAGAVRLNAGIDCFLTHLHNIESFKKSPAVLSIRKLGWPPVPDDLATLALDPADLAAIPLCQPASCDVKLPPHMLEDLEPGTNVQTVFRHRLFQYIEDYLAQGDSALLTYRDKAKPMPLAQNFRALLNAAPGLKQLAPEFHGFLLRYPQEPLSGTREFLYRSTETFGLKPVSSVTHVLVHRRPDHAVAVSKQIYANHYFNASLGLTYLLDSSSGSRRSVYLAYINRSDIDLLGGLWGGFRRRVMRGRLLEGMRKNLVETARRVDAACQAPVTGFDSNPAEDH